MDSDQINTSIDNEPENVLAEGDTNFSDLEGIDMEIIDDDEEVCLDDTWEDPAGLVMWNKDLCGTDVDESKKKLAAEQSASVVEDGDDSIRIMVEDSPLNDDNDMLEFMKSLGVKGATGLMELTIAGVPSAQVALTETAEIRTKRKIIVHNIHPSDLGTTIVQELFRSERCIRAKLDCEREVQLDDSNWHGHLELTFGSADVACAAMSQLRLLRDDVRVDYCDDSSLDHIDRVKMQEAEMKPWIGLILIIKNIGEPSESCRVKLSELFPDADIVFRKDNPSEVLKGKAYLIFPSKETAQIAIKMFKRDRPKIDGRRLILLPWSINQILPEGMLKIGERRLALKALMETEDKLAKHGLNAPYLEDKHKALCEIVARDTKVRHTCGFPAPSYNQMKSIRDLRDFSDAEQGLIMRRLLAPYNCGVRCDKNADDNKRSLSIAVAKVNSPAKPLAMNKTILIGNEKKSELEATKFAANQLSATKRPSVQQVTKSTASGGAEKKPVNSPVVRTTEFNKQSSTASNATPLKKPISLITASAKPLTMRDDSKNRSFVPKGKTPGFNKQSQTSQKTMPSKKPTPLLDLPLRQRTAGTGLLGTPPLVRTVQKPKPLLSLNPGKRQAPGPKALLPEPLDLLPAPPQVAGRSSLITHAASHESDSILLLKRPPPSNTRPANSAARSGLLGNRPVDVEEPPAKILRAGHHQRDYEDLHWATPDLAARFNSEVPQQVKDKYDLQVARERLTQTIIEEGRSKTSGLLNIEMNRSGAAQNQIKDRASLQSRSLLDLELSRLGNSLNRNVDRLSGESRVQCRSLFDVEIDRPGADWRDNRVTTSQPQSREYQQAIAPYDYREQVNSRLSSFDVDEARSLMSHASDRGIFDRNESPASLLNQDLPRERERREWNNPVIFSEVDDSASDSSYAWNVANSRNDVRAVSNSFSARSSSPLCDRGHWSRGERQEDLVLGSVGANSDSRRWQGAGLPDVQKHGDDSPLSNEPSDQTDTVSLLRNLSQLLADKLQRDREKKRNRSRDGF